MKRAWIWILLGLSLGVNAGVLGTAWFEHSRSAPRYPNGEPLFLDDLAEVGEVGAPAAEATAARSEDEDNLVDEAGSVQEPAPAVAHETEPATRSAPTSGAPRSEAPPAGSAEPSSAEPIAPAEPGSLQAAAARSDAQLPSAQKLIERLELDPDQARDFLRIQRKFFRDIRSQLARIETLQRELRSELTRPRPDQAKIDRLLGQLGRSHAELESAFTESVLQSREILDEKQESLYLLFVSRLRARAFGLVNPRSPGQRGPRAQRRRR